MRTFHYYHKDTGVLHGSVVSSNVDSERALAFALVNAPADHLPIEGNFDRHTQRIDVTSQTAVDYQPPQKAQAEADTEHAARVRIAFLEREQQPRAVREALLGGAIGQAAAKLKAIDDEICELRKRLIPPT